MPRDAPATDDESDEPVQLTRGAASLAALALLTGALSACGDDEPTESTTTASPIGHGSETDTDTSTSSSSSSSSSGSGSSSSSAETVAELPEAATERTREGAIAFNEFYQVQMGEALKTAESATLREYSKGCALCTGLADRVDGYAKKGIHMNTNPNSVVSSSATERDDGGWRVEVDVSASEYYEVYENGDKGRTAEAVSMTLVSDTQWSDGRWEIRDLVVVEDQ